MSGSEWLPVLLLDLPVTLVGFILGIGALSNTDAGVAFLVFGGLQWYLTGEIIDVAVSRHGRGRGEDVPPLAPRENIGPSPAAAIARPAGEPAPASPLRPPRSFTLAFTLLGLHTVLVAFSLLAAKSGGEMGGMALLPIGLLDFPAAAVALLTQAVVPSEALVVPTFVLLGSLQWFLIGTLFQRTRGRPPEGGRDHSPDPQPTSNIAPRP
jgi:hypothetical protein